MLDPEGKFISARLFRENCVSTFEGVHIKDLRVIRNRRIEDIIIVDNSLYCFGFQLANGIPILPFYDDSEDEELLELELFLMRLRTVENAQIFIQTYFCYKKYVEHSDNQTILVSELASSIRKIEKLYDEGC